MSGRRACREFRQIASVCGIDHAGLRLRLPELVQQRRRFGYRRLHVLLRRNGITINRKKIQRLYREGGWRFGVGTGESVRLAPEHQHRFSPFGWSLDFVHDQLAT